MRSAYTVGVVVLAAGLGTRMRSQYPKVTHTVAGRSMLEHVLRAADAAFHPNNAPADDRFTVARYLVVLGHEAGRVQDSLRWAPADAPLTYVIQHEQLGTGHAVHVAQADATIPGEAPIPDTILVLYGDTPLIRPETLRSLLTTHAEANATLTFLTGIAAQPNEYGRVVRDATGRVSGIVEQRHATPEQMGIQEVNSGVYLFAADWLWPQLARLVAHPNGEYYLTDLVTLAAQEGQPIATVSAPLEETLGVNDRVQLAEAERIMRARILQAHMLAGVTVVDPASTYVDCDVRIGQDTVLRPGTSLRGKTMIGERCEIGPQSVVRDSQIGADCVVLASWVEEALMEDKTHVGPMSHLRPGARLKSGAYLGNYAEVKNATIGERVQMHHFSYIGDATLGADTNVGAGTITMNYDGHEKHHTTVGERVFLGCDTLLRAPVTIEDDASTGAGSVVTRDVPAGQLALGMPARIVRKVRSARESEKASEEASEEAGANSEIIGKRDELGDNHPASAETTDAAKRIDHREDQEQRTGSSPDHPPERAN